MTVELVTGRAGTPHVSSGDDRAYHAYTAGAGRYVLHGGGAEIESANNVHLDPAEILVDGAFVRITGSGEDVTIENGASSYDRVDVIALHYMREGDGDEAIESVSLAVVKGTPVDTGGDAQAPSMPASGSILDGVAETYVPYYSVKIVGLTPQIPELVMEEYVGLLGLLEALAGGTTGQILRKASSADYDTEWLSTLPVANGGTGGTSASEARTNLQLQLSALYNSSPWFVYTNGRFVWIFVYGAKTGSGAWDAVTCPHTLAPSYRPAREIVVPCATENGDSRTGVIIVKTNGQIQVGNWGASGSTDNRAGVVVFPMDY